MEKEKVAKDFQFLQHYAKRKDFVGMYHASLSEQTKNEKNKIYSQFEEWNLQPVLYYTRNYVVL